MSNPDAMSMSIDRDRTHEMLAELGTLVTTTPGPDATPRPPGRPGLAGRGPAQ